MTLGAGCTQWQKKVARVTCVPPESYPLRGFVICESCGRLLTASGSKGRSGIYNYYHCKYPCYARHKSAPINNEFFNQLEKFQPLPGRAEVYKKVICDLSEDDKQGFEKERKHLISEIAHQNNMLTKIRGMFLSEDLDQQDYKIMNTECEEKILKLEAELKSLKDSIAVKLDL